MGDGGPSGAEPVTEVQRSVTIISPAEGAEIDASSVTVTMRVAGLTITTAGDFTENTGHHHLLLNVDIPEEGTPIPVTPGYVHRGDGSSEHTFGELEPGQYRLIALVGDGSHVPLTPIVADTVTFRVR